MTGLVLSLFPGIGLLDQAFEEEGFCVVRGPDLLWGGDIKHFHPPAKKFDGVIGGPPCQAFSRLRHIVEANGYQVAEDLIPEYERCVSEARPTWFLMENVEDAPEPSLADYANFSQLIKDVRLQGLPDDFDLPPFTTSAKIKAIGNGVPLAMGRAVAQAIKLAISEMEHVA